MDPRDTRREILIAVPDSSRLESIADAFDRSGFACRRARDGLDAWAQFNRRRPLAVFASDRITGLDGIGLLTRVRRVSTLPFVMEVGESDVHAAVEATRLGASAIVQRTDCPLSLPERLGVVLEAETARSVEEIVDSAFPGRGAALVRLRQKIIALAQVAVPVVFTGEPGSGRTHAARTLCRADGVDRDSILVATRHDTAVASPESLGGKVVVLQNVESFPLPLQARWSDRLKSLDSATSRAPRRVLATADRELERIDPREFLPELAARLSRFSIEVPPLRDYRRDMRSLIERFGRSSERRMGKGPVTVTPHAAALLQRQPWPGNARQLREVVEQLIAYSRDGTVSKSDVQALLDERAGAVDSMRQETERRRRSELVQHLEAAEGNLAEVARRIGMSRGAVIYRAQKFGLLPDRKSRGGSEPTSVAASQAIPGQ